MMDIRKYMDDVNQIGWGHILPAARMIDCPTHTQTMPYLLTFRCWNDAHIVFQMREMT